MTEEEFEQLLRKSHERWSDHNTTNNSTIAIHTDMGERANRISAARLSGHFSDNDWDLLTSIHTSSISQRYLEV